MIKNILVKAFRIKDRKEGLFFLFLGCIFFCYFYCLTGALMFSLVCSYLSRTLWGFFREYKRKSEEEKFTLEFQGFLYIFSSQLETGKSMENSLRQSIHDLENIYGDTMILLPYLEKCLYYYGLGKPIESGLLELRQLYKSDWLVGFIDMLIIARTKGGDFINLIKKTSQVISERLEIEGEIAVILAKQNLEVKILRAMPFILLLILKSLYPEMIVFLTSQSSGLFIFIVAASLIGFSFYYSNRLVKVIWS